MCKISRKGPKEYWEACIKAHRVTFYGVSTTPDLTPLLLAEECRKAWQSNRGGWMMDRRVGRCTYNLVSSFSRKPCLSYTGGEEEKDKEAKEKRKERRNNSYQKREPYTTGNVKSLTEVMTKMMNSTISFCSRSCMSHQMNSLGIV